MERQMRNLFLSILLSLLSLTTYADICGGPYEDYDEVQCYKLSDPKKVERSTAVARMFAVTELTTCSAFRVSSSNLMVGDAHCLRKYGGDPIDPTTVEIWFGWEQDTCFSTNTSNIVKTSIKEVLYRNDNFVLFSVLDFDAIAEFGWLGLDINTPAVGDEFYIAHHAEYQPKKLSIDEDTKIKCAIDAINENGIYYNCDTWAGAWGAPLVLTKNNLVTGVHTRENCPNEGRLISEFWPDIAHFFNNEVPLGDDIEVNQPPIASFGLSTCDGMVCVLDGSRSTDPEGGPLTYLWDMGEGSTYTGVNITHYYQVPGEYDISLTVTDDNGLTSTVVSTIYAIGDPVPPPPPPNEDPVAAFNFACVEGLCNFDASNSTDSDGTIQAYRWTYGDGNAYSAATPNASHTYSIPGDYIVSLSVVDDDSATDSISKLVDINIPIPNNPPVAIFSYTCDELVCNFDGSDSRDTDGTIVSYLWSFGATQPIASYTFVEDGSYYITLTVGDDDGANAEVTTTVTVAATPPPPPVFNIELTYSAKKARKGYWDVTFTWSGADTDNVNLMKGSDKYITTTNDGSHTVKLKKRDSGTSWRVCESPGDCSNFITLNF